MKIGVVGNDRDAVFLARSLAHFECHGHAADAGAQNDDVAIVMSPFVGGYRVLFFRLF